ncbi:hypothetical protein OOT46_10810 [Aquabacterium sp. A7-Y]|nr:hypothetical protein [Aquabacterium sp. A7-Y]MCW7538330.1 hypothetical protein [Aquabacterium sp. A7-Y]
MTAGPCEARRISSPSSVPWSAGSLRAVLSLVVSRCFDGCSHAGS